jgi:hypothetical protein
LPSGKVNKTKSEEESHYWLESINQVGEFRGTKLKIVLEIVSWVEEKTKLDNYEENEELSLKKRKDYEMERIAFNLASHPFGFMFKKLPR